MGEDVTAMGRNVTDVGCEKTEPRKELKKHAATIHCSNTLSLLQRKITNALLYHAYKELMLKDEHEITVKQLCRLIGYQGNNHSAIKEAFKGLISTVIEWNLINDETGAENWTASSIIASVSLEGPLCYYAYSPRMKQLLHSPSMFGKIDLVIQSRFRSSYGLALYENCIRYRGLPNTKWFEMDLFKKLMGVPAGKYDIFRDFKRRVLDKAVEEVNTYSDLVIESEFVREGRKVLKVRFKLKERAKKNRLGSQKNKLETIGDAKETLKLKLIQHFSFSEEQAEQLFKEYDNQFIEDKISLIEDSKPYQDGKVKNMAAYLLSAIKNNYQPATKRQAQIIDLKDATFGLEMTELKRHAEEIRHHYQIYRENFIHEAVAALKREEKQLFLERFYLFAEPTMRTVLKLQGKKYKLENVLESPQMKALLRQFALQEMDMLEIPSLEEFVVELSDQQIEAWQKLKSYDPDHPLLRFSE
jgi:plasmid replication initiation protein